jgi:surface antigen Omp85-like protein
VTVRRATPLGRLLPWILLLLPLPLSAQGTDTVPGPPHGDSTVVRAVELERRDVFDPSETGFIPRLANALHIQTRAVTVRRELLFRPGEPYDSASVAESERNLRSLGIFRRVTIDSVRTDSGLVMRVITRDGWSTKTDLRFRSVGGDVEFTVGLVEDNLLGTASSASARFRKTTDRSTVALGFRRPRLFGGQVGMALAYEDRSDGRLAAAALEQPFYSMTSRSAFRVEGEDHDERVLRFFEGEPEASDTLQRRYSLVRATGARAIQASSAGFLRLGIQAQVRRDDFVPEGQTAAFGKTVTGAFGPYLTWNQARFVVTKGVAGFAREEDVDLGATVTVSAMVAPEAFGYERDGIAPMVTSRIGIRLPSGFGYLEGLAAGLYTGAGLDSGAVQVGGTAVLKPRPGHVTILHAEAGWLENPLPGAEFDLGLSVGPRAYGSHAFTGDRSFLTTAEYRITVAENFLGQAGIGLAGFVDYGGAWYAGSRRRTGWDTGLGIRLGATRSSDVGAVRLDLAHRFANDVDDAGWVITIGKGFVFGPLGRRAL